MAAPASSSSLRIAIHDYGCYPFILELSREFARRGHQVRHFYFAQNTTPQAVASKGEILGPAVQGLTIGGEFRKWSMLRRYFQEREYGAVAARAILAFSPDIVISANTPIDSQLKIDAACRERDIPVVLWLQDLISVAMGRILSRKLPVLGPLLGRYYGWQEAKILRRSAAVIAIAPQFLDLCEPMGVPRRRCHVIENWAPLGEMPQHPRQNAWSDAQGLSDKRVLLYSGNLGFKHNPMIFERLALHFRSQPDIRIVVISEGPGAAWLRERKDALGLDNLILLPFQPYARLPEALSSGDVLLAILDEEAGTFSVPSKILTYLAAGRAVLLSIPMANLAAETVRRANAGRLVAPGDIEGLLAAADRLLADSGLRESLGRNGRAYAERTFDVIPIADRIDAILREALNR